MDEAEKYQERLQAIAEKRRMQEEEEKVRREMEEECLKLAHDKRKTLREQWLMDRPPVTSSSPEDPKLQSMIPAFHTTEQSAEESQSLEKQMKKEVEKSENINEESPQIGENVPSALAADNKEKPAQAYLEELERNVIEMLDVKVKRNAVSEAAQADTEEKTKATTEEQEVDHLAVEAVNFVDLSQPSLQHVMTPDEANLFLDDDDDEEWEIVTCSSEEGMDMVLKSDLTQDESDSCLANKHDEAVLEVEQIFIMDEEEDLEVGASEVLSLVVAKRKSDLEDTSCEKPNEGALPTLCLERAHVGTSALLQELGNVPGTISKEPSVFSVEPRQNLQSLPAHATCAQKEILGDNTKKEDDRSISASTNVKVEWKEASSLEDEVRQHIPLDKKREQSTSLLRRKIVAQSTESEIQILSLPSGTLNRAETVTSNKRNTCHCCTVM